MSSRVSCISMQGWFKRQIPSIRREGFFPAFFSAFLSCILPWNYNDQRGLYKVFFSFFPSFQSVEDWSNSQTQATHLCHSSHIAHAHAVKGFTVRKGTDEMLKMVKLCYIYRCSHLFYMCLHLWQVPESSMGMFSIGVVFFGFFY